MAECTFLPDFPANPTPMPPGYGPDDMWQTTYIQFWVIDAIYALDSAFCEHFSIGIQRFSELDTLMNDYYLYSVPQVQALTGAFYTLQAQWETFRWSQWPVWWADLKDDIAELQTWRRIYQAGINTALGVIHGRINSLELKHDQDMADIPPADTSSLLERITALEDDLAYTKTLIPEIDVISVEIYEAHILKNIQLIGTMLEQMYHIETSVRDLSNAMRSAFKSVIGIFKQLIQRLAHSIRPSVIFDDDDFV